MEYAIGIIIRTLMLFIILVLWLVLVKPTTEHSSSSPLLQSKYCYISHENNVLCNSQYSPTFDLLEEFRNLSYHCNDVTRDYSTCHYRNLFIHQSVIHNITSFLPLSFDSVHIYSAEQLEWIDKDDNQNNERLLNKQVFVNSPSMLNNSGVNRFLQQYTEVLQMEIALASDRSHQLIMSFCYPNETKFESELQYLIYKPNYYEIDRIEKFAFDCLSNLKVLKLAYIPIRFIDPNAFSFMHHTNLGVINLDNCQLTESILDSITFSGNNNSVLLMLGKHCFKYHHK